jgi:hypothetical protein
MARGYARAHRVRFSGHARRETREAGACEEDVVCVLANAHRCRAANVAGRWKLTGPDLEEEDLDVVVVFEDGVVVITVM